jgi:PiT family inorganic phosphate transporter
MGANNVSNAIGTSVGSGAISRRNGLILAGICEFLGTILMGGMVTQTLKSAIISPELFFLKINNTLRLECFQL